MAYDIQSVAVLGGGTMGSGIAAACVAAGRRVLLLEIDEAALEKALARTVGQLGEDEKGKAALIETGTFADLARIADYDWICEAVVEDLATKRGLFEKIEALRGPGSVISTNTSGIPLRDITAGLPERLRREIVVTHFFNPVRVMRLLEVVPGADTLPEVVQAVAKFGREALGKGVVYAKDTVNFIGNRIGCFWMLSGLHIAKPYLRQGLPQEEIDALMGEPVGLPSTGLYGLIDLIGLDVMDLVGKNLAINLPQDDAGRAFTAFPQPEQTLLERRQLGRKSGGGFYKVTRLPDGQKKKEVFDLLSESWRPARPASLPEEHRSAASLLFSDDPAGHFAWDLLGGTLLYAAGLIPQIADDIVNVDRAIRWGFNWKRGPFELLDEIGPRRVIARLQAASAPLPHLLQVLDQAGAESFYRRDGREFLGLDGRYHPVPAE